MGGVKFRRHQNYIARYVIKIERDPLVLVDEVNGMRVIRYVVIAKVGALVYDSGE